MTTNPTHVVSAVIIRAGRILLTQRKADADFAFGWCSPGGTAEAGETHRVALRRECAEEIGCLVRFPLNLSADPLWSGDFSNDVKREDRRNVRVFLYLVDIGDQIPIVGDGMQGLGWFTADEMLCLKLAPANARAAARIAEAMGRLA